MNRHSGLLTRLRRLEAKMKRPKSLPPIIMGVYIEDQPGPVIGIEGGGMIVRRKAGELAEALQARAAAEIPSRWLRVLYAAPTARNAPPSAPEAAPASRRAPMPGIGREASRDELRRMGAIPVPPERPV